LAPRSVAGLQFRSENAVVDITVYNGGVNGRTRICD